MLTTLSALWAIAEREEHEYGNGPTEFAATCNNLGTAHRLLFHPWHDHYHLLHHLYSGIPQFNHKRAHRLLMAHDPAYRDCPVRLAILGTPVKGKDVQDDGRGQRLAASSATSKRCSRCTSPRIDDGG